MPQAPKTRPETATQTLGTHQATWVFAYDFAPGCVVAPNSGASAPPAYLAKNGPSYAAAGTVIALPGAIGAAEGGITLAGAAVSAAGGAAAGALLLTAGDQWKNPNLVSFRRYDYAAAAPLYLTVGRNIPKTFAAPMSDPLVSSSEAQKIYSLPGAPRDAYYIFTIDPRDNPYIGPTVVKPHYGQPGGGNEVIILGPVPAPQIRGPFPLPPDPTN